MTREKFGAAYERGFDLTVRFLISRGVRNLEQAKEVAQAAWAQGWKQVHQLRNEGMVMTWINTIGFNIFRSGLRKDKAIVALEEFRNFPAKEINLDPGIDLERVLKHCRLSDRSLLHEQRIGRTARELCQGTDVTESAMRLRFLRARQRARAGAEIHTESRRRGFRLAKLQS